MHLIAESWGKGKHMFSPFNKRNLLPAPSSELQQIKSFHGRHKTGRSPRRDYILLIRLQGANVAFPSKDSQQGQSLCHQKRKTRGFQQGAGSADTHFSIHRGHFGLRLSCQKVHCADLPSTIRRNTKFFQLQRKGEEIQKP